MKKKVLWALSYKTLLQLTITQEMAHSQISKMLGPGDQKGPQPQKAVLFDRLVLFCLSSSHLTLLETYWKCSQKNQKHKVIA